jgi:Na+-driven multidrug efflux pump
MHYNRTTESRASLRDLTHGPIARHVVSMAAPVAAAMIFQTLYYFVDLYFVAHLGDAWIAGVSAGGNATFLIMASHRVLGVGTVALISQAVGRKHSSEANLIFNQSLLIAALLGVVTLVAGGTASGLYVGAIAAGAAAAAAGTTYLHWFAPGLALQFAMVAMASALRATSIVQPAMVVQVVTLFLNALLAPVFIAGWGTHHPLGVAGAGLASSVSLAVGVVMLWFYFTRRQTYLAFHAELWQPRFHAWKRILTIGLPAGGEFALMFLYTAIAFVAQGLIFTCSNMFQGLGNTMRHS